MAQINIQTLSLSIHRVNRLRQRVKTYALTRSVSGLGVRAVLVAFGALVSVSPVALSIIAGMPSPTATAERRCVKREREAKEEDA